MTTFDRREEAFERKFAVDEELLFKAHARRDKMLGLWAAGKLGLSGAEAEAYARDLVAADLEEPGDADVLRKLKRDFEARGVAYPASEVDRLMNELLAKAMVDVRS